MRSLTTGLLAAQKAPSGTPYVLVVARQGSDYSFFSSDDRLISVEHTEQPYGGNAIIRIENQDKFFSGRDYRGADIGVCYGYKVAGNPHYSMAAPLHVFHQQDYSLEGQLYTEFQCVDDFQKLAWNTIGPDPNTGSAKASAPAWNPPGAKVDSIRAILWSLLAGCDPPIGFHVDSSDGIENSYMPYYVTEFGSTLLSVIANLLEMTTCVLRSEQDGMHLRYLDPSADIDYEYDSAHVHYMALRDRSLVLPNWVIYVDKKPMDESPVVYHGAASDWASIAAFGKVGVVKWDVGILSDAEATDRAESTMERIRASASLGTIRAPMNCGQELYDWVQAEDTRSGLTVTGWVGGLIHRYDSGKLAKDQRNYTLEIALGGLTSAVSTTSPDALIRDAAGYPLAYRFPGTDWPGQPVAPSTNYRGVMPWYSDIVVDSGDLSHNDKDTHFHWHAGTIYWNDGFTWAITQGEYGPYSGTRFLYFDLAAADPHALYVSSYLGDCLGVNKGLIATMTTGGEEVSIIGRGTGSTLLIDENVAIGAIDSAQIADGAVVNSKVATHAIDTANIANAAIISDHLQDAIITHEKLRGAPINHENIQANEIWGGHIAAGQITADKILAGNITADHFEANAIISDIALANIILADHVGANQVTAGKIGALAVGAWNLDVNSVYAAHIAVGQVTADKINVGYLSAINANLGIVTVGQLRGGLGSFTWANSGGTVIGSVGPEGNFFCFNASWYGYSVRITADGVIELHFGENAGDMAEFTHSGSGPLFQPSSNNWGCIGALTKRWRYLFASYIYYADMYDTWDDSDDIELIRAIKTKHMKGEDGRPYKTYDNSTFPEAMTRKSEDGETLVLAGGVTSLTLGAIKQMADRIDTLAAEVEALKGAKP